MPVSKKRKKKRIKSSSGPPLSKKEVAAKKRKLTRRQILIYVFSALIILSFALSFIVGFGGRGSSGGTNTSSGTATIQSTPVPSQDATAPVDTGQTQDAQPSESDTGN